tara:strand:- start:149 stop:358 length:210 start_codon:yes stop_codon:yes gene_type:complete
VNDFANILGSFFLIYKRWEKPSPTETAKYLESFNSVFYFGEGPKKRLLTRQINGPDFLMYHFKRSPKPA